MAAAPRLIKKYPNRRLYDTGISGYITLENVRQLVLTDEAFVICDARTGSDITRTVLLQVIAECESRDEPMLSTQLLGKIIHCQGQHWQTAAGQVLEDHLAAFINQRIAVAVPDPLPQTPDS
ncbi:MAG TPA: polyhydroxyalkanoate synthesis repressor PhaR [Rhodanobacteraceae bacterium]